MQMISSPVALARRESLLCLLLLLLLLVGGREDVVDDRVEEHTADADGAAEQLDRVQALPEHDGNADDDNDALGRVGHRLGHRAGLLDRHRRQLVVAVEPQAGRDQVEGDHGVRGIERREVRELGSLPD
eukprot:2973038-Rhodomonas_salina.1